MLASAPEEKNGNLFVTDFPEGPTVVMVGAAIFPLAASRNG
jgi:hypothetical protein